MRIGAVAAAANVNEQTLRYYERKRLIAAPSRTKNGYRDYPAETVAIVRFIKRAQDLGFALEDARQLLTLREQPATNCFKAQTLVETKLSDVNRRLADLLALRSALVQLTEHCRGASNHGCAILEALDGSLPLHRADAPGKEGGRD